MKWKKFDKTHFCLWLKYLKPFFSIGYFKTEEEWGAYDATEILGGMLLLNNKRYYSDYSYTWWLLKRFKRVDEVIIYSYIHYIYHILLIIDYQMIDSTDWMIE